MLAPLMGTTAHLVVVGAPGGDAAAEQAAYRRLLDLESRWTRFRHTSELAGLNANAGRPVVVSGDTYRVIERAVHAWWLTGGRYDPTVHDAVVAAGYDRSFEQLAASGDDRPPVAAGVAPPARPSPGCGEVTLCPTLPAVVVPEGVHLDLGGIGKGFAADLAASDLVAAGVQGACVNIGGDLRAEGSAPTDDGWIVAVEDPADPARELCRIAISAGAVATSTSAKRRWTTAAGEAHHLIDPVTGQPARTDAVSVTVVAGEAWLAEVLAKAAFLAGVDEGLRLLDAAGVTGLVVTADGDVVRGPGMDVFAPLAPPGVGGAA